MLIKQDLEFWNKILFLICYLPQHGLPKSSRTNCTI